MAEDKKTEKTDRQRDERVSLWWEWWMKDGELDNTLPYPWCIGAPTRQACRDRGYCARNPNCGE